MARQQPKEAAEEAAPARPLRADAARNRARLLEAADVVFAERGANASLEDVAQRAGVGIGTLYRHFATREVLLAATCDDQLIHLAERSRKRTRGADPVLSMRRFLVELVRIAGAYSGLATSFGVVLRSGGAGCHASTAEGARLVEAARDAGAIRSDVSLEELVDVTSALAVASGGDDERADKLVGIFVDGLRR